MEQIFMIELLIKKIVFKIDPPEKDEYELRMEAEERKREAELQAAIDLAAAQKAKKKKKKKGKNKKGKKKKKKDKGIVIHNDEKQKFLNSCLVQANCLPVFNFFVAHDIFVPPPPPVVDKPVKKKGKKKKPKPKKKGKKGKKPKPFVKKLELPLELLPNPPFFGVGSSVVFISRPSELREIMKTTPLYMSVWNRDEDMECIGFCTIDWHSSFLECLIKAEEMNQVDMDKGEFRNTKKPSLITNTIEMVKKLECEDFVKPCGEIELYVRLSCLGNRILSSVTSVPEIERVPCRHYITDELNLKNIEVVRNWKHSTLRNAPAVAYFYGAPDIAQKEQKVEQEVTAVEDFVAHFTDSELVILSMGFPKGPCGGVNCPLRMCTRGTNYNFVHGEVIEGNYIPGAFVNERDVHGPCGRINCPLAVLVRSYLTKKGAYKKCQMPCAGDYY